MTGRNFFNFPNFKMENWSEMREIFVSFIHKNPLQIIQSKIRTNYNHISKRTLTIINFQA